MSEHELRVSYAGYYCTCGGWRIGSWNDADRAFAKHVIVAAPTTETEEQK